MVNFFSGFTYIIYWKTYYKIYLSLFLRGNYVRNKSIFLRKNLKIKDSIIKLSFYYVKN